ncbi:expressed protein [Chlorella variabilis]|uniref:Expressed protein n=1 Tax=Chlorella variabilis TaxID=554065 RepID=E1ZH28_CHLVA|nr:expressed protein [Chlorella variabilis]EFN54852.1 expressed protein [Chlorella variabilis]|eukprot:XP_005846954.1 expressed protein [Chlorella variabilis]
MLSPARPCSSPHLHSIFTLSVVDSEDGSFLYNIFVTDNLNTSQSVSLVFVKDDAIKTAITLNDFDWADASNGGSQGNFSKQALLDGLVSQGQLVVTELFPLIILSSNATTTYGISGHFVPVWNFDPTPPASPPPPPPKAPPTFPLVGYGYVAQLQGDRVPDESVLEKAPVGPKIFATFTYDDNGEYQWDLTLDAASKALQPTSFDLYYETDGFYNFLLTLAGDGYNFTGEDPPYGTLNWYTLNDAVLQLDLPDLPGQLNETNKLWLVVTTLGGSLAARFSDPVEEPELPPTDDTFFLADIVGNATFSFGVPKDLKWPAFANSPATQFTLSIVDTEDGSFLYNIFVTDDLNKSAYLALAYKNASGFHVALKLPVDWAAANVGGDVNYFTKAALRNALVARGQKTTTELFPLIAVSVNATDKSITASAPQTTLSQAASPPASLSQAASPAASATPEATAPAAPAPIAQA